MESKNLLIRYINAIFDILVMLIAYVIANKLKFGYWRTGIRNEANSYMTLFMIFLVAYFVVLLVFFAYDNLIERNLVGEIAAILKLMAYMLAIVIGFIYLTKTSDAYSRIQMGYFVGLSLLFLFFERQWLKQYITKTYHKSAASEKIMLITTSEYPEAVMKRIKETKNWYFRITNMAILDKDLVGNQIDGIEVVADKNNLMQSIENSEVDAVFIYLPQESNFAYSKFIEDMQMMGKQIHLFIPEYELTDGPRAMQFLGKFATVTWNNKNYRIRHKAVKRFVDIVVGAMGTILLVPIWLLAVAGHWLEKDSGHTIVSYVRVGKSGRRFYQYHFRTMQNLQNQEDVGTISGTGAVLKKLGLTNLPMALNILWGDMSLVGAEAPSLASFLQFSKKQRKALSSKPGVIQFWPAYYWNHRGKNEITIEKCEAEYVEHWTLGLDVKVLLRTIGLFLNSRDFRSYTRAFPQALKEEEYRLLKLQYEEELPIIIKPQAEMRKSYIFRFIKRTVDIIASALGLLFLSPIMLVIGLLIRAEDGQNVFYKQLRIGQNGKKIYIYKFRSMMANVGDLEKLLTSEQLEQYKKEFKIENDPRVTRIGNILRKTSLDELPQLLNILKGDLSLVGPRPIVEKETVVYGEDLGLFLSVRPGLTGYWQAYARNNATYESGERQKMELHYAKHASIWFDIKILCRTVIAVLRRDGAM